MSPKSINNTNNNKLTQLILDTEKNKKKIDVLNKNIKSLNPVENKNIIFEAFKSICRISYIFNNKNLTKLAKN